MGVFLGGRIGDVFFYNFDHFVQDPLYLFRVWEGGMSFHGGLIGVIISMIWTSYSQKEVKFLYSVAIFDSIWFRMGRIGNFINLELGDEKPMCLKYDFPKWSIIVASPSFTALWSILEGFVLFIILNVFIKSLPCRFCSRIIPGWLRIFLFYRWICPWAWSGIFLGIMIPWTSALFADDYWRWVNYGAWAYNRSKSAVHQ